VQAKTEDSEIMQKPMQLRQFRGCLNKI
jgi:hypothetical protein